MIKLQINLSYLDPSHQQFVRKIRPYCVIIQVLIHQFEVTRLSTNKVD